MLMNNLSRFKCKTGVLVKNNLINDQELTKKIMKKIKLKGVDQISFSTIVLPSEISIEQKNSNICLNLKIIL